MTVDEHVPFSWCTAVKEAIGSTQQEHFLYKDRGIGRMQLEVKTDGGNMLLLS